MRGCQLVANSALNLESIMGASPPNPKLFQTCTRKSGGPKKARVRTSDGRMSLCTLEPKIYFIGDVWNPHQIYNTLKTNLFTRKSVGSKKRKRSRKSKSFYKGRARESSSVRAMLTCCLNKVARDPLRVGQRSRLDA